MAQVPFCRPGLRPLMFQLIEIGSARKRKAGGPRPDLYQLRQSWAKRRSLPPSELPYPELVRCSLATKAESQPVIFDKRPEFRRPVVRPYRATSWRGMADTVCSVLVKGLKVVGILIFLVVTLASAGSDLPSARTVSRGAVLAIVVALLLWVAYYIGLLH